jgi:hypothetical protein
MRIFYTEIGSARHHFMNLAILTVFASTLVLLCGCKRTSGLITDATYTPASLSKSDTIIVASRLSMAQTFKVTTSGKLSRVDVPVRWSEHFQPNAPLRLDVRRLDGLVPKEFDSGADILASSTVSPPQIPTKLSSDVSWVTFNLPEFSVERGDRFAIVLSSPTNQEYHWAGDMNCPPLLVPAGTYAGGQAFSRGSSAARDPNDKTPREEWGNYFTKNDSTTGGGPNVDMGFRVFIKPFTSYWYLYGFGALFVIGITALYFRRTTKQNAQQVVSGNGA